METDISETGEATAPEPDVPVPAAQEATGESEPDEELTHGADGLLYDHDGNRYDDQGSPFH